MYDPQCVCVCTVSAHSLGYLPPNTAFKELQSPRHAFLRACRDANVPPEPLIVRKLESAAKLSLAHYGLGDRVGAVLATALADLPIVRQADLTGNRLSDSVLARLTKSVAALDVRQLTINPLLRSLTLAENKCGPITSTYVEGRQRRHSHAESHDSQCRHTYTHSVLEKVLRAGGALTNLSLRSSHLNDAAMKCLAVGLAVWPPLPSSTLGTEVVHSPSAKSNPTTGEHHHYHPGLVQQRPAGHGWRVPQPGPSRQHDSHRARLELERHWRRCTLVCWCVSTLCHA